MTRFVIIPAQRGVVAINADRVDNIQEAYDQSGSKILGFCAIIGGHMTVLVKGTVESVAELLNDPAAKGNGHMALRRE